MTSKKIIALSGASGFLGKNLKIALQDAGYEVWPLVREKGVKDPAIFYDYTTNEIERDKLAHCYGVIHLAGKNLMEGSWSKTGAQEIYDSRVKSAELLAQTLGELKNGPKVFLCASAIGFYGDGGAQTLNEKSHEGKGFLADLCVHWEKACVAAKKSNVRVVNMRFGAILDKSDGMLKTVLPLFRAGLGGPVGSGTQFLSFIALSDICRAIIFLLQEPAIEGPVNLVSPTPLTNADFAKELAFALKRPACLRVPALAVSLALGPKSVLVLSSSRVVPQVLLDAGFKFTHKTLGDFFLRGAYL